MMKLLPVLLLLLATSARADMLLTGAGNPSHCNRGGAFADGCAGNPFGGQSQFPNLLVVNGPGSQTYGKTYVTRPGWNAPGVDYYVGIPPGTVLASPSTISMAGVTVGSNFIQITGSNVTLSGYDFTDWQLRLQGNNTIIKNSKVGLTISNGGDPVVQNSSGNQATFLYDEMNGGGVNTFGSNFMDLSPGIVMKYCYMHNVAVHGFDSGLNNQIQWNLFYNAAGSPPIGGFHADQIQIAANNYGAENFLFNTFIADNAVTQGLSIYNYTTVTSVNISYNVGVFPSGAQWKYFESIALNGSGGTLTGAAVVSNNFLDPTGIVDAPLETSGALTGSATYADFGNTNLVTGGIITAGFYADGATAAVAAADSFPTLFTSPSAVPGISNPNAPYPVRPPWNVAGVDYPVGIPTGTTLKNVSTMTTSDCGASCTISAGNSITVRDANITLTAWDFCNGNGGSGSCVQLIQASGATNLTLTNSFIGVGTNLNPIFNQTATNAQVTFINDYFDSFGRQDSLNGGTFTLCSSGATSTCGMTLEYSFINRGGTDEIDYGLTNTVKYNLFKSMGLQGGHADWIQECGACNLGTYIADFNTWIQDACANAPACTSGTQGIGMFPGTTGTMNATLLQSNNNTIISYTIKNQPNYYYEWYLSGSVVGGGTIGTISQINNNSNYVDPSGAIANGSSTNGFVKNGTGTPFAQTGNVNLVTGGSLP